MLAEILSRYKSGASLLLIAVFCLGSLIWQSNILARSLNTAVEVLDFFTGTFHTISNGFGRFIDSYGTYQSLKTERDALRNKLKESQDISVRFLQLQRENESLRKMLDLPSLKEYPVVQAQVISQDPDNWFRTIIINKGSDEGIEPYMPVIAIQVNEQAEETPAGGKNSVPMLFENLDRRIVYGVVGKIIQVNSHSARILPLTDQYSKIGVLLRKSGHWAYLSGQNPYADLPKLEHLALSVFLKPGDEVVTSGGNGIFPRGLLIGTVTKEIERLGGFQTATVKPALDLRKLDFVTVIRKKPEFYRKAFSKLSDLSDSIQEIPEDKIREDQEGGTKDTTAPDQQTREQTKEKKTQKNTGSKKRKKTPDNGMNTTLPEKKEETETPEDKNPAKKTEEEEDLIKSIPDSVNSQEIKP